MNISTARDEWIMSRTSEGYKPGTLAQNRRHLNKLIAAVGDINVRNVTARHVDQMLSKQALTNGPGALGGMHATLLKFFRWCRARGYMRPDQDPMAERRAPKHISKPRLIIPMHKFPALLDAAERRHPRDRAVVALGIYTLARQSEIQTLRVRDVDLSTGELLMFQHKTSTYDEMPVSSELDAEMRRWLTWYTERHGTPDPDWYLVPACTHNRKKHTNRFQSDPTRFLAPRSPVTAMETIAKLAISGVEEPLTDPETGRSTREGMHTLRRSAARALYDELRSTGYDSAIRQVQVWLHHKSIQQTEGYIQITPDRDARNRMFRGKPMYPSLQGSNVVQLREAE